MRFDIGDDNDDNGDKDDNDDTDDARGGEEVMNMMVSF